MGVFGDDVVLGPGESTSLPHTLSATHHLRLTLRSCDAAAKTALFELRNPEAVANAMAAELIEQNAEEIEHGNRVRDRLHVPEKAVPVDTSTRPVVEIHARLHEHLLIGDRVWKVARISADEVTLAPGHDFESEGLFNQADAFGYSKEGIAIAQALNRIDEGL